MKRKLTFIKPRPAASADRRGSASPVGAASAATAIRTFSSPVAA